MGGAADGRRRPRQGHRLDRRRPDTDLDRPPELKLAGYRNSMQGPRGLVLVWVAVDPHSEVVEFGPDIRPARTGAPDRCPLYVVVDAASGRGYGAWQSCDPPYRG